MIARLVYDGGGEVRIPPEAGTPRDDQMQGTPLEQLCELAGKLCYDSLGKGRNSQDYHAHIAEVGHTSVHEHGVITVWFETVFPSSDNDQVLLSCLNRRGVWCEADWGSDRPVTVTANLRAINEWTRYTDSANETEYTRDVGYTLASHAERLAPAIVNANALFSRSPVFLPSVPLSHPDALTDHQAHVTLYLSGSRSWSHEMVRHRYAMSQRSTRYCDESEASHVLHPTYLAYLDDPEAFGGDAAQRAVDMGILHGVTAYMNLAGVLANWLVKKGVDPSAARKQARGAAARSLPHSARTEMLFTAPVAGWRDILRQRLSPAADAEIRAVAASALDALRESRYAARFADLRTVPSPDGLGVVLAGGGL